MLAASKVCGGALQTGQVISDYLHPIVVYKYKI
jgi:hypothetical protein